MAASGATWLDRQAIARDPVALGQAGFGAEVRDAMQRRAEQLIEQASPNVRRADLSSLRT